jgi:hypothetical protein
MAVSVRNQNHGRSQIANFLNPDNGLRGKMKRMGQSPKDHMKENRMELKALQQKNRDDRDDRDYETQRVTEKAGYKLPQFREVETRLYEEPEAVMPRVSSFLTKNQSQRRMDDQRLEAKAIRQELDAKLEEARYFSGAQQPTSPRNEPMKSRSTQPRKNGERDEKDFIGINRVQAIAPKARVLEDHNPSRENRDRGDQPARHAEFGRVPDYLEQRKARWAEEEAEARRRAPDPDCPRGMCLMPEAERISTLEILHTSKAEAMRQLQNMPFVVETPSQKKKQVELETKLREIERAISLFSRPKVYVAQDSR